MAAIGSFPGLTLAASMKAFADFICDIARNVAGSGLAALHRHTYIFAKSMTCALIATSVGRRSIELAP